MTVRFVCLLLLASACGEDEAHPMILLPRNSQDPQWLNNWGQVQNYDPPWPAGAARPLLNVKTGIIPPQVVTVTLGLEHLTQIQGNGVFRWRIRSGVGGAAREWLIDALPLQQVSLVAYSAQVDLVAQNPFVVSSIPTYFEPANRVRASAFLGVGNTSTEQACLTHLYGGSLAPAGQFAFPIPPGASSFRLIGTDPTVAATGSVFQTGVSVQLTRLTPILTVPALQLYQLYIHGESFPLIGSLDFVAIANNAPTAIDGFGIQWRFDL